MKKTILLFYIIVLKLTIGLAQSPITYFISPQDICAANTTEITIPVQALDFNNVTGFQFSLEWNTEMMEYIDLEIIQPAFVNNMLINENELEMGRVGVFWNSSTPTIGTNLPDSTTLIELKFQSISAGTDTVEFVAIPTLIETVIFDGELQILPVETTDGIIDQYELMVESVIQNQIGSDPNGSINLDLINGQAPFEFNWSNGETSEDLFNIPTGTYTVTITDNQGCQNDFTFFIDLNTPIENIANQALEVQVYPTYIAEKLQLVFNKIPEGYLAYKITTPEGKLALEGMQPPVENFASINLSHLSKGLYYLNLELEEKKYIFTIIKQ